ncbi:MAG: MobF family relaxase [Legionellaceae bacterium]|nr:MobF family relaxase [Legionellaceae bacterium]
MLSIKPLDSAKDSHDYYMKAVAYYQSDSTATQWLGSCKSYLNLEGSIDSSTFLSLLQGHLPNGQKLQNPQGEHRPGVDMTFSAPKSVSILVGLGAAPELMKFHDDAVKHAISHIEKEFAEARVRQNGQMTHEKTGNLLIAAFRQPSSRANDPALHTHCVALNMTFLNDKARSLASDKSRVHGVVEQIQNHAHYGGLLYRQHLANSLKDAGFHLRLTGDGLFEIDGIPDAVLTEFSRRREDIERLMQDKGWSGAKSATLATLITRPDKEELDPKILTADWMLRAKNLNFDTQAFMQTRDKITPSQSFGAMFKEKLFALFGRANPDNISEIDAAKACVHVAIETLSQRTSVFTERALKFESLKHSLVYEKSISQSVILDAIKDVKKTQHLYEALCPETEQPLLTTPRLLTLEAETIARIEKNKGVVHAIATKKDVEQFQKERTTFLTYPMTASQRDAMFVLLTSQDRYLAIQGYAGVAKTTMLSEARLLMMDKGYQVRGIAVASSAANELQTKSGITSSVFPVIYQELKEAKTGSLNKTIFIVDEASMLSSPQGHELIKQIERTQARLVLVGDRAQLPSVNNGRIFGLIQDYGVETATMNDIVRQKNQNLKEAVVSATLGDVKAALEKLDIQELPTHEARIQWIASRWLNFSKTQREETLLFAPTHKDRTAITELIRNGLKQDGSLQGPTYNQTTLKAKPIEPVQQRFTAYYQQGDVVRFNQAFKKQMIQYGEYYTVGHILPKHRQDNVLPLVNDTGKTTLFALKALPNYKSHTAPFERAMEIYQKKELELQVGDKIMWTRNVTSEGIRNGETLILQAARDNHLIFTTKNGQELALEKNHSALKHLDYSYVLTNYKVQGKDAPYGIGLMESYHRFGATMKNFYVQISRAIHGMTLVTDDKELLSQAIQRNNDEKQAALDIVSSLQLDRFKKQTNLSIQFVIDKKLHFEKQANELRFEKISHQKTPEYAKEIER